jgi:hypothetical protein
MLHALLTHCCTVVIASYFNLKEMMWEDADVALALMRNKWWAFTNTVQSIYFRFAQQKKISWTPETVLASKKKCH